MSNSATRLRIIASIRSIGRLAGIAAVMVTTLLMTAPPSFAQSNAIERVIIAAEERDTVTFDVVYNYNGDRGNVFVSVVMAQDGETSPHYATRPGMVEIGRHRTRIQVGVDRGAPALFSTNQVQVRMYAGGGSPFLSRNFAFAKTWSRPGGELQALPETLRVVPEVLGQLRPLSDGKGGPVADAGNAQGALQRRILPNGRVQLRYADGTIRELFPGGETITRPGSPPQTRLYSSAQPPTPPSAPPDLAHAAWLDSENARLLDIIRLLVGNDEPSVQSYLSQENTGLSPYERIVSRTQTISWLVSP